MHPSLHEVLGAISVVSILGYLPYLRDIVRGTTRPHALSWLVWGVLTGIAFFGQVVGDGGPGTWVTGTTSLGVLFIFVAALLRGERTVTRVDWLSFVGAGAAISLWFLTTDPLGAMLLVTLCDLLGYVPTIRKSLDHPEQETLSLYVFSGAKFLIGLFALDQLSLLTMVYPLSLVLSNLFFVVFVLFVRWKQRGEIQARSAAIPEGQTRKGPGASLR